MNEKVVRLQSQEFRAVDEDGNEQFGEVLYVNGKPVNKEGTEETTVVGVTMEVLEALGIQVVIMPDLEPLEVCM